MNVEQVIQFCIDTGWSLKELREDILNRTETEYERKREDSRVYDAETLSSIRKLSLLQDKTHLDFHRGIRCFPSCRLDRNRYLD